MQCLLLMGFHQCGMIFLEYFTHADIMHHDIGPNKKKGSGRLAAENIGDLTTPVRSERLDSTSQLLP